MNLADVLHDAVDDIEPADRIDAIRARTASSPARAARRWFYAAGGVVLATAATVAAFAVLDDSPPSDHGSMVMPTENTYLVPAYFIGDTPGGKRLFREFDHAPGSDPVQAALDRIQQPPTDPDYATGWGPGSFGRVTVDDQGINVELSSNDLSDPLAVQQVVYTLQGAVGERLPVSFRLPGQRGNAPYQADPAVLSRAMISDPSEGLAVHEQFVARGAAPGRGTVRWQIRRDDGFVVAQGDASGGRSWHADIDVTGLQFGFYTFVATAGRDSDTRTIIVR